MSKLDVETLKGNSGGLRGTIPDELALASDHFSEEAASLLKFHGVYQQDDRDARRLGRDGGGAKAYGFMVRTKNPGGFLPARFYAAVDDLADRFGNGTIRVTTRGGLQLHGVPKENLRDVIAQINDHLGSTLGACGDINRNVMAPPFPFAAAPYAAARAAARAIAELLTPRATAYYEIWQDGEVVQAGAPQEEPIYGKTFLPRKFKVAVATPGDNSVDLYTNDLGVVPLVDGAGTLLGYNLAVGGGLGMTHRQVATYPRLADEFAFVGPDRLLAAARAIVIVQRDHGDRVNRKHARLKYLIDDRGLDWFRAAVETEAGFTLEPWRPLERWTVPNFLGWHAQGDGHWFYGLSILSGRIGNANGADVKRALREIVERTGRNLVATPNQNILIVDVDARARAVVDEILARCGVARATDIDPFEKSALACPALPTCGLSLAESERALPSLLDELRAEWRSAGLAGGAPVVRMTGCPNGCARPYLGEVRFVGVSADRYNVYVGGNAASTRLNVLFREKVERRQLAPALAPLFRTYAVEKLADETFGDFCVRARVETIAS
ncbi:MAG: NADPH-dependent assimilatory sulfite reductase hemoprotein subunit [Candidatus Eremiobacteraeota bacterium]|nr:NADPH-dependent assimilatory sulfite reductase hemoprotein subunit [Candidatus Eremiobacteraeota bacterium]